MTRLLVSAGGLKFSAELSAEGAVLETYLPILIFLVVGVIVGGGAVAVGYYLAPHRPDEGKGAPYECGFEAFDGAHLRFNVRYYLVAILFILFDLEIAFLFPWAIVLPDLGFAAFWPVVVFLAILVVGFIYEWKKGALEWE